MYKVGDVAVMLVEGNPIGEITIVKVLKTGLRVRYTDGSVGFLPYKLFNGLPHE